MPGAKNGERPYPEAPKWHFWDPCIGAVFRLRLTYTLFYHHAGQILPLRADVSSKTILFKQSFSGRGAYTYTQT